MKLATCYSLSLVVGALAACAISHSMGCSAEADPGGIIDDGSADQDGDELAQTKEAITTPLGLDGSSWGVDATVGQPYTKCLKNGPSAQDCRFARPYQIGDSGFLGIPTRYRVMLHGNHGTGWPTSGAGTFSDVSNQLRDISNSINSQIQNPQLSSPVLLEYADDFNSTIPNTGVNVSIGTLPAGGNSVFTDTFFSISFSGCRSSALPDGTLPGNYRSCDSANAKIDINKLRATFSGAQLSLNMHQVLGKIVVTGLGAGRQENVQGYPSNRRFNDQESSHGGVYLIADEYKQLRCVGFTFGDNLGFDVTTSPCGG